MNIKDLNNEVGSLKQEKLLSTVFAHQSGPRTLTCESFYDDNALKAMLVNGV